jgi:hypothetical protein
MNTGTWTTQLNALKESVRINGRLPAHNARIPKAERDPATVKLAYFVTSQRKNRDSLSMEQRAALEDIPGFLWRPLDKAWDSNVQYFANYVATHRRAPSDSSTDARERRVAQWAAEQRALIRGVPGRNAPTADRQKQLTALPGWERRTPAQIQADRLQEFTDFLTDEARIPRRHSKKLPAAALTLEQAKESALFAWLSAQRLKQRKGALDAGTQQRLEQLLGAGAFPNAGK